MFSLLVVPLLLQADAIKTKLRYLRPAGERFVLESELEIIRTPEGSLYKSRTVRGDESMTLRVERGKQVEFLSAKLMHQKGEMQTTASAEPRGDKLLVTRGERTEEVDVKQPVIFTTAPDWSDIFEMAARFDPKKAGKQEFAGLWFHPTQPSQTPKFSIERLGSDTITLDGNAVMLTRCRARIRGGSTYLVWILEAGRVCKLAPEGGKGTPVVLEGFEKATKELK